jgi:hypothetical protein
MITNPLDVFQFHGVSFNGQSTETELISTCPFCGKEGHFYINKKEGLFNCKRCGKSGNAHTFLHFLHDQCLLSTSKSKYTSLSRQRALPASALSDAELAYDPSLKRWLIPIRNARGTMVNLRCWTPKSPMLGTKSCDASIYGLHTLQDTGPIYICEGEWDAIALEWLLYKNKETKASVVAVPGANTFKNGWHKQFGNRSIILLYDNDQAGKDGMNRVAKTLATLNYSSRPSSIKIIDWPESYPDKYDIKDLISRHKKDPKKAWHLIESMLIDFLETPEIKKIRSTTTFSQVVKIFKKHVYVNDEFKDALALCCAVVHSSKLETQQNPLWLFIVGPPSCGKTLVLRTFRGCFNSLYRSRVTAKTLVSGFKTEDGSDPSLIREMIGRCFILKDFTEITTMASSEADMIYGVLRGFYDGFVEVSYGNAIDRHYEGFCSILAGVTPAIHKESRVTLGERFLKYSMIRYGYDQDTHVRRSLEFDLTPEKEKLLQDTISEFLDRPLSVADLPPVPKRYENKIIALSQIIAHLRAIVERKREEILYRPLPEVGTRLYKQLTKLMSCVAVVYGLDTPNASCYSLIERVALDTATGWHQDVCVEIAKHGRGINKQDICDTLQISPASVERSLNDLLDLGVIRYRKRKVQSGRPPRIFYLSPYMRQQWKKSGLDRSRNLRKSHV